MELKRVYDTQFKENFLIQTINRINKGSILFEVSSDIIDYNGLIFKYCKLTNKKFCYFKLLISKKDKGNLYVMIKEICLFSLKKVSL